MLKLKLQYFGLLMWRSNSFEKTLMLGRLKAEGERDYRGWDGWMASLTQWTCLWVNSRSWWWAGRPGVLQFMGLQSPQQLSNWTELIATMLLLSEKALNKFRGNNIIDNRSNTRKNMKKWQNLVIRYKRWRKDRKSPIVV